MPKKVNELIAELKRAGFAERGGRGSHRNFLHPKGIVVTVSGRAGDDALPYQLKLVRKKIEEAGT
jgi:predicted RNA binding protein YcfA (HicA-like mRNA interferase family)